MTPHTPLAQAPTLRHDWTRKEVLDAYARPFNDLLFDAQTVHRQTFDPNRVQLSQLLSIKTGGCPEDCGYCPQASRYDTGVERQGLMDLAEVVDKAKAAKANGATRFCMGAAWRSPKDEDLDQVCAMVEAIKDLGMETCVTLGMLEQRQAQRLKESGLDYYNHNIDSDESFYTQIISTRNFDDRIDTLGHVRQAGLSVCAGGIIGMGESRPQRAGMLVALANLPEHPQSVPINMLVRVPGTPLADVPPLDPFEMVRTIAVARIMMPKSVVRLSAGRETMTDELQAMCFFAGANSLFFGETLLTTPNPTTQRDFALMSRLGIQATEPDLA